MKSQRLRIRPDAAPPLHWDGTALHGTATGRTVEVTVPARLVSFRHEAFPPAAVQVLQAAVRMRAERAFGALGPVAIDALLAPVRNGRCDALLMALPQPVLTALRQAALDQKRTVTAVRVAELLVPVPVGGVVQVGGDACLVACSEGRMTALAVLGRKDDMGFAANLMRERLRLGVAENAPGCDPAGPGVDFLHPAINAPQPMLERRGVRLALLGAGIAAVVLLAVAFTVSDALAERATAKAEAERLKPLATALAARRTDLKELAGWFEDRPTLAPGLNVLAKALPTGEGADQMRLTRVRQVPGEESVAEGLAGDRGLLMAFVARLRQDPRVASAEVRSYRSVSKGSGEVTFELGFRLATPGASGNGARTTKKGASDATT